MAANIQDSFAELLQLANEAALQQSISKVNRIYVRGDVHGNFDWLAKFCEQENTTLNDVMILAGDSGLLFYGKTKVREELLKKICGRCSITLLVVRGNHDNRPANEGMHLRWNDLVCGDCYWEDEYPNILYAKEIGHYWMRYRSFLTIGGAYSVDKFYRLQRHWTWYPDEELTDQEMAAGLEELVGEEFDYIISHTAPLEMEPTWLFMQDIDQTQVSKRMEKFLQKIKNCVNYKCWFWGHYHDDHHWPRLEPNEPLSYEDPAHIMLMYDIVLIEDKNEEYSFIDSAKYITINLEDCYVD